MSDIAGPRRPGDTEQFARQELEGFFRRRDEQGRFYCAACLAEQLAREGGNLPCHLASLYRERPRVASNTPCRAEGPLCGLSAVAPVHRAATPTEPFGLAVGLQVVDRDPAAVRLRPEAARTSGAGASRVFNR